MSKRHHNSRRKSYGRRQHELRERAERYDARRPVEPVWDEGLDRSAGDRFSFLDPAAPRLRYALGD